MNFPTILLSLLSPSWRMRWAAVRSGDSMQYVLAATHAAKGSKVLYAGSTRPKWAPIFMPLVAESVIDNSSPLLVTDDLHGTNPEAWVDQNEFRIIPRGFASDQVVNEWSVHDNRIYSATVTKKSFQDVVERLKQNNLIAEYISLPLWDLALLYSKQLAGPFILWKLEKSRSLLGAVNNGRLQRLCNFWVGIEDVRLEPERAGNELSKMSKTLHEGFSADTIVLAGDGIEKIKPGYSIPDFKLSAAPHFDNIKPLFHECLACALHEETRLNFASFNSKKIAGRLHNSRIRSLRLARTIAAVAASVFIVLGIGQAAAHIARIITEKKIEPLSHNLALLDSQQKTVDSLQKLLERKATFSERESSLTLLMNDLQMVFPDGVWMDQLALSEVENRRYSADMTILSYSTGLVPELLNKLSAINGVAAVRMLYSEQTTENGKKEGKKAVKCKVNFGWADKR